MMNTNTSLTKLPLLHTGNTVWGCFISTIYSYITLLVIILFYFFLQYLYFLRQVRIGVMPPSPANLAHSDAATTPLTGVLLCSTLDYPLLQGAYSGSTPASCSTSAWLLQPAARLQEGEGVVTWVPMGHSICLPGSGSLP